MEVGSDGGEERPAASADRFPSVLAAAQAADWLALEARLAEHPHEAMISPSCRPLHAAVAGGAPLRTVQALLDAAAGSVGQNAASATETASGQLALHRLTSATPVEGAVEESAGGASSWLTPARNCQEPFQVLRV